MRFIWAIYEGIVQCIFMWISAQYLHTPWTTKENILLLKWNQFGIAENWLTLVWVPFSFVRWCMNIFIWCKKERKELKTALKEFIQKSLHCVAWRSPGTRCDWPLHAHARGALYHLVLIESRRKIILARYIQEIKVWKVIIPFHCGLHIDHFGCIFVTEFPVLGNI